MSKTIRIGRSFAILALGIVGCRSHPAAETPVAPDVSLLHYAGSPLSEPAASQTQVKAADAYGVEIQAYLLPVTPHPVLRPFAAGSKIITAAGSQTPLQAIPTSLASARMESGEDAQWLENEVVAGTFGKTTDLGDFQGVLAPGLSVRMTVSSGSLAKSLQDFRQLQLVIHRPEQADAPLRVALLKQTPPTAVTDPTAPEEQQTGWLAQSVREMEICSVDFGGTDTLNIAVLIPVDFAANSRQSVLFHIRITPASDDASRVKAVEQANRDLAAAGQQVEVSSFERLLVQNVLKSTESDQTRRAAMVYLATQTQASIFEDTVLVADDGVLQTLAGEMKSKLEQTGAPSSLASIGWTLDRTAFDLLGRLRMEKKLSPELSAVLSAHAGEAGRSAASLEQLVGKTLSHRDLHNRLIAENYIFLEDISPAARVRAYDWLKLAGAQPKAYDPMGPADQRQKALEAAIEEMSRTMSNGGSK